MTKSTTSLFKGVGLGMAAGLVAGAAGTLMLSDSRRSKNRLSGALRSMENVLENMQDLFRS